MNKATEYQLSLKLSAERASCEGRGICWDVADVVDIAIPFFEAEQAKLGIEVVAKLEAAKVHRDQPCASEFNAAIDQSIAIVKAAFGMGKP